VLVTNVITYFVLVALLRTHYPDPTPLIVLFLLESAIAVLWVLCVKAFNNVLFPPHQLLLIHGNYSVKDLVLHVNERSERYVISEEINVYESMDQLEERIAAKETAGEYAYEIQAAQNHLSFEQTVDWLSDNMSVRSVWVPMHGHIEKNKKTEGKNNGTEGSPANRP
jgi:hypothetical protein